MKSILKFTLIHEKVVIFSLQKQHDHTKSKCVSDIFNLVLVSV